MNVYVEPKDAGIETPTACTCCGHLVQTGMYWAAGCAVYECDSCKQETVVRFPSPLK